MRVPKRKPGEYTHIEPDYHITQEKYNALEAEAQKIKDIKMPRERSEVKRLADMGDFSENAAYQIAKGRLRRYLYRLEEIKTFLKYAIIIKPDPHIKNVQLGSIVKVKVNNQTELSLKILGKEETDPSNNIISHKSDLGALLIGNSIGDTVTLKRDNSEIIYNIIDIDNN